ncbi:MAG: tRNA (adenosine(37)-N6)-dimethylallyltransferase MiaA [Gammaproteobacteria bacterium]
MSTLPIIFLMGPTATGKTDVAVALAEFFPIEIISVDSALVYKGMDIGTAKPSLEIRHQVPHHLIDIRDPSDAYSAAHFCKDVHQLIPEIFARGHLPLLVGGTMMYYRALTQGLSELPCARPDIRAELDAQAQQLGWQALHQRLGEIDPTTAARLHPNDAQRIQRALEIYLITGKSLSENFAQGNSLFPYSYQAYALAPPERAVLHERIAQRFYYMLQHGFIEEVQGLMQRTDLDINMPAMRAVGYRQVWTGLIAGEKTAEIAEKGIAATRQLAKRQLTWLRSWPDLIWFDSTTSACLSAVHNAIAAKWPT